MRTNRAVRTAAILAAGAAGVTASAQFDVIKIFVNADPIAVAAGLSTPSSMSINASGELAFKSLATRERAVS